MTNIEASLVSSVVNHVQTIKIVNPNERNALTGPMLDELGELIAAGLGDDDVTCLVLAGQGGHFSSGASRATVTSAGLDTVNDAVEILLRRGRSITGALFAAEKPSFAVIDGACAGAGVAIAAACTFRVISNRAFVRTAYARLNLAGDLGIGFVLPKLIGQATARRWLLTDTKIEADELLETGFADFVSTGQDMSDFIMGLTRGTGLPREDTTRAVLQNTKDAVEMTLDDYLGVESTRHIRLKRKHLWSDTGGGRADQE